MSQSCGPAAIAARGTAPGTQATERPVAGSAGSGTVGTFSGPTQALIGSLARLAIERFHQLGVALDRQHDRTLKGPILGAGHQGNDLAAVGQIESYAEAAIWPQRHWS